MSAVAKRFVRGWLAAAVVLLIVPAIAEPAPFGVTVTVKSGVSVSPTNLTMAVGTKSTFTVSEPGYTGPFTIANPHSNFVEISPGNANGPGSVTYKAHAESIG